MDEQYEKAAEQLEDDKIYLTTNTSLAGSYRFLYGKNVFLLKDMQGELQKYLQDHEVYYIGNVGELDLFHVQAEDTNRKCNRNGGSRLRILGSLYEAGTGTLPCGIFY